MNYYTAHLVANQQFTTYFEMTGPSSGVMGKKLKSIRSLKALSAAVCKVNSIDASNAPQDIKDLIAEDYL